MEQIITEALFWKQLQIGAIATLLMTASLLSIWNLPWKEEKELAQKYLKTKVVSDKNKQIKQIKQIKQGLGEIFSI